MKCKAYCLYPTLRISKADREKYGYKLGYWIFAKINGKKCNYNLLPPYKYDYLWASFPKFEDKKGGAVIKKGKTLFEKPAMYDGGTKSMKEYADWYNEIYDKHILVDGTGKLKQGDEVYVMNEPLEVETKKPKLLGKNLKYVMGRKGVYLPHSMWYRFPLSDGQRIEVLTKKEHEAKVLAEMERELKAIEKEMEEIEKLPKGKKAKKAPTPTEAGEKVAAEKAKKIMLKPKQPQTLEEATQSADVIYNKILTQHLIVSDEPDEIEEVMGLCEEALSIDPNHYSSLVKMGTILMRKMGRYEDALAYLKKALSVAKDDYDKRRALMNMGLCYAGMSRTNEAANAYNKALKYGEDKDAVNYQIGMALVDGDRLDEALSYFKKVSPGYPGLNSWFRIIADVKRVRGEKVRKTPKK
jgi:tetratricopeptide (TPR) repeat protein